MHKLTFQTINGKKTIEYKQSITMLELADSNITYLPCQIDIFTNLKTLFLDNNLLKSVPIDNLINLRSLNLCDNQIKWIPLMNTNLRYLYLSDNQIKWLPFNINLCNLEWLYLENNPIIMTVLSKSQKLGICFNHIILYNEDV